MVAGARYCTSRFTLACATAGVGRGGPHGEACGGVGEGREHAAVHRAVQVRVIGPGHEHEVDLSLTH